MASCGRPSLGLALRFGFFLDVLIPAPPRRDPRRLGDLGAGCCCCCLLRGEDRFRPKIFLKKPRFGCLSGEAAALFFFPRRVGVVGFFDDDDFLLGEVAVDVAEEDAAAAAEEEEDDALDDIRCLLRFLFSFSGLVLMLSVLLLAGLLLLLPMVLLLLWLLLFSPFSTAASERFLPSVSELVDPVAVEVVDTPAISTISLDSYMAWAARRRSLIICSALLVGDRIRGSIVSLRGGGGGGGGGAPTEITVVGLRLNNDEDEPAFRDGGGPGGGGGGGIARQEAAFGAGDTISGLRSFFFVFQKSVVNPIDNSTQ